MRILRTAVLTAAVAIAVAMGGTGGPADGQWPDVRVAELWPTFASLPVAETGGGGLRGWDGAFTRCLPVQRVALDFACEYADAQGRLGYACVAAPQAPAELTRAAIDARVAPDDPTYGAATPTKVCIAARAYALSLG